MKVISVVILASFIIFLFMIAMLLHGSVSTMILASILLTIIMLFTVCYIAYLYYSESIFNIEVYRSNTRDGEPDDIYNKTTLTLYTYDGNYHTLKKPNSESTIMLHPSTFSILKGLITGINRGEDKTIVGRFACGVKVDTDSGQIEFTSPLNLIYLVIDDPLWAIRVFTDYNKIFIQVKGNDGERINWLGKMTVISTVNDVSDRDRDENKLPPGARLITEGPTDKSINLDNSNVSVPLIDIT